MPDAVTITHDIIQHLAKQLCSDSIRIVLLYVTKNLWEYPNMRCGGQGDSDFYETFQDFLQHRESTNIEFFTWNCDVVLFEDDQNGNTHDMLTMSHGQTASFVSIEKSQQDDVKRFLKSKNVFIPSSLDIQA
jgi:hypothetical protein